MPYSPIMSSPLSRRFIDNSRCGFPFMYLYSVIPLFFALWKYNNLWSILCVIFLIVVTCPWVKFMFIQLGLHNWFQGWYFFAEHSPQSRKYQSPVYICQIREHMLTHQPRMHWICYTTFVSNTSTETCGFDRNKWILRGGTQGREERLHE